MIVHYLAVHSATAFPAPQKSASSSMPSSMQTVLSTSKHTALAPLQTSTTSINLRKQQLSTIAKCQISTNVCQIPKGLFTHASSFIIKLQHLKMQQSMSTYRYLKETLDVATCYYQKHHNSIFFC